MANFLSIEVCHCIYKFAKILAYAWFACFKLCFQVSHVETDIHIYQIMKFDHDIQFEFNALRPENLRNVLYVFSKRRKKPS